MNAADRAFVDWCRARDRIYTAQLEMFRLSQSLAAFCAGIAMALGIMAFVMLVG